MRSRAFAVLVLLFAPAVALAQVGTSTDIITGKVMGPDSVPLAGARVQITSTASNAVKGTLTRADGRFTVLFRDGGGAYNLVITFLGMQPARLTLQRQADEDRLVVTVKMSRSPQQLATVEVRGRTAVPAQAGASAAGGSERTFPQALLERMPMNPGDLEATATLVPGILAIGGTDSTRASFSVAAQPASQNNISVDGMSFLFGSVPQDAVRQTRVVLNAYDVARGQFTGGQVATTTKAGTSAFEGTANYTGRARQSQFAGNAGDAFAQKYSQNLASAGIGGPLYPDRAFYFVSGQFEQRGDDALTLLGSGDATLAKLGATRSAVDSLRGSVNRLGIGDRGTAPLDRESLNASGLVRVDVDVSDAHALMLRGDYRRSHQRGSRVAPLALPNTGGVSDGAGGGGMAMLTSVLGGGSFINELRVYHSEDAQRVDPYLRGPAGVVTVASTVDNRQQIATMQFGGSPGLPRETQTMLQEGSEELSWLSNDGGHRIKLGVLLNRERSTTGAVPNRYGVFLFNSLSDVDANKPALYARTLAGKDNFAGSDNAAVYLGDAYRRSASLQLTYGVRVEGSRLPGAPVENTAVTAAFGRRNSDFPTELHASPRLGLTYLIGNLAGVPKGVFRVGIGEFRGKIPTQLVSYVANNTGDVSQSQLVCVGPSAPTPNWSGYLADTTSIPTTCVGPSSPLGSRTPNAAMFGDEFGAPRVWRASMGLSRRVFERYGLTIDGLYAYGMHNPSALDMNLNGAPSFVATGENRPVFAPSSGIVTTTGAVALAASRVHPEYGTAFQLGSTMRSHTGQLTTQLTGGGGRWGPATVAFFSVGYTFLRSRDETNGYPFANSIATTGGDPRVVEWGTSDLERRHNVVGTALILFPHALELSVIGRLIGGAAYTPTVNGDVNGDGLRNDRAFIFASSGAGASTDTAVTNGMTRLLANIDSRARDCLTSQVGGMATRNSCATPWFPGLDLQLNWRPDKFKFDRRVTISLVAVNTLAGFDQLLHGSRMHGWGQPVFPDRVLLNARGFDQPTQTWKYQVNEHFGNPSGASNPVRLPFQLGLQVHIMMGADPTREALKSVYGTADGKPPAIVELKARIMKQFPNPFQLTLDVADSLKLDLTRDQSRALKKFNEEYATQADTIVGGIAEVLTKAGPNPDPGTVAPKLQKAQIDALKMIQKAVTDIKTTLTPEQWAKLPDRIRFPLQAPAARPQQPPRPPS